MPLASGTRLGPYEILSALGSGGMGEVYRAIDRKLGREVAVKVIPDAFADDPERIARFQREAQALAALNHPNIAAIFGFEESGRTRALVMELVEGLTLAGHIAGGPIPLAEALPIARQIADALEAAHERGIIHRDLKPANVKVTPEGQVKVLDFGLAKAIEGDAASSDASHSPTITFAMTRAGVILGTAGYMSPEQAKGKRADRRADIWAFGVVLFEMLAGRQVYAGETAAETLASVMKDEPGWEVLPRDTPAAIRGLLRRCLEKDPKRRLQAIGEARITMDEVLTGAPPEATSDPAPPRGAFLWRIIAAATTLVALAAGAVAIIHFRETPPPEPVLRYTIAPPEKSNLHTFALSPDGRYLAIAASVEGKRQLWLRPLDSLQAQALPGTEDAVYPFWSPDSRNIGFFAQGKLKKITVGASSGTILIQALCNAPDGRGGAWNKEGVIVFAPDPTGGLQRVPAAGGLPAQVTKTDSAHRFPIFLPDGRHFLFLSSVQSDATEKDGIYLGLLGSQETRRVLPDVSSVVYATSGGGNHYGHLLLIRENTLTAQPFDTKSFEPVDDPFPIAERTNFGTNTSYAQISASDNGMLVFEAGRTRSTQLAWFDRSGKQLGPVAALGTQGALALSPDEKSVAVVRHTEQGTTSDIWLHEFSRGSRSADTDTRFTFHPSRNDFPVWSPDGSRIVFASSRGRNFGLYLKDASGSRQEELLVESPQFLTASDWSRDGRMLVYTDGDPKTKADLWILPIAAGAGAADDRKPVPFLQTEFNERQGQFSPDGHWMAYTSDESGRHEVYVRPFPSGRGKSKVSIAGGQQPRWRRDGKELFYLALDRKLMAVVVKAVTGPKPIFALGTPEPLFEANVPLSFNFIRFDYAVAGDGKRFLVQTLADSTERPITVLQNWPAAVKR